MNIGGEILSQIPMTDLEIHATEIWEEPQRNPAGQSKLEQ